MSAASIPSSWQNALENHSISSVKALEKQLRASALRDKEKLRDLVGSNYRELLATAEQIVELDVHTRDAEAKISSLSQACKPPSYQDNREILTSRTEAAGQLKLLEQSLRCASSAVNRRAVLQASKIFVIARLLLKHVEDKHGFTKAIRWLQAKLKTIRQQLTHQIDGLLLKPSTPLSILVQCISANCLLTSTSSTDAVRYFRTLRLKRLAEVADHANKTSDLRQSCYYLTTSITAIKALSGRVVIDLLNEMQQRPILESSELLEVEALQLDINQSFLPPDIVSFTPYFKRVTPSKAESKSDLQQWIEEATQHVIRRIVATLADANLVKALKVRQEVLEILLLSCFSTALHVTALSSIRGVLSKAIIELIGQHVRELEVFGQNLSNLCQAKEYDSLWSSHFLQASTTKNTVAHLRAAQRLHLGVQGDLEKYIWNLRRWSQKIQTSKEALQSLAKIRWQDKIEEYDDEDEETAQEITTALWKDDTHIYIEKLADILQQEAENLTRKIEEEVSQMAKDADEDDRTKDSGRIALMLRAIREIRSLLKSLLPTAQFPELLESTAKLHKLLAQVVTREFFTTMERSDLTAPSAFTAEGLPSPLAVSILQNLCSIMLKHGGHDLWTVAAVEQVGKTVHGRVTSADTRDFYIRNDFDDQYISIALGVRSAEQITTASEVGLRKANAYWSRTKALFGVLNV